MTEVLRGITYARETLTPEFAKEILPLLEEHFLEIDPFQSKPLDPDWDAYFSFQLAGFLRVFTARDHEGTLIGYSVAFVRSDLHHKGSTRSSADIFFIRKDRRGFGLQFLLWCNDRLREEGIEIDFQHISDKHDWGKMAARAGYGRIETVWGKVL